jgi:hypothetical protein
MRREAVLLVVAGLGAVVCCESSEQTFTRMSEAVESAGLLVCLQCRVALAASVHSAACIADGVCSAAGVDFPHQFQLMTSYLGILDLD